MMVHMIKTSGLHQHSVKRFISGPNHHIIASLQGDHTDLAGTPDGRGKMVKHMYD